METTLRQDHPGFAGRIGVARRDITPPVGIYARNWGAAEHETAEGVHRPLTITALSLQEHRGGTPLLLFSADLGWWRTGEDEAALRSAILDLTDQDPARVVVAFTHTHSGPSICREDQERPGGHLIPGYLKHLAEMARAAALEALSIAEPASIDFAYGVCDVARNRDLPEPDADRILCGYNPAEPADDTLLLGRVVATDGRILATIVNYACHPITLSWRNRLISPDFVGAMREVVEGAPSGAPCLFLQGASGELSARDSYVDNPVRTDAVGRAVGYAALSTLEEMLPNGQGIIYRGVVESGAPLALWEPGEKTYDSTLLARRELVSIDLKEGPGAQEIALQIEHEADPVLRERLRRKLRVRRTVGEGDRTLMPVWIWRIGSALLVGLPNEAYSVLQITLRAALPDFAVMVCNCANGHAGYLPPRELYCKDIYPVWQSPFAEGCLEKTIDYALTACRQLAAGAGV